MSTMTCTQCYRDTGVEWQPDRKLSVEAIVALCRNWRCDDCLDDDERTALPNQTDSNGEEP